MSVGNPKADYPGCVHDLTRFIEGRDCAECDRERIIFDAKQSEYRAACAVYQAMPWWKRLLTDQPVSPWV